MILASLIRRPHVILRDRELAAILIMDEETDSRMLLKRLLELSGHDVAACRDSAQALAQAGTRQFDLAVLSIASGRSDVTSLSDQLKAYDSKLKVMTITDYKSEKSSDIVPGDDFLFRPVELETIEAKVEELLMTGR